MAQPARVTPYQLVLERSQKGRHYLRFETSDILVRVPAGADISVEERLLVRRFITQFTAAVAAVGAFQREVLGE